jgi:IS1 family transposase
MVLAHVHPEQVEGELCRAADLARRRGLTSELDEMWSYVGKKANPRWLWHAIDHRSGTVWAYVFGRRQDDVFLQLKALLVPFGITRFYTDGWGAYERHLDAEHHAVGKEHTQKIETLLELIASFGNLSTLLKWCKKIEIRAARGPTVHRPKNVAISAYLLSALA